MRGDSYQLQGQQGGRVATTGTQVGRFRWIQIVNDAVLSGMASPNLTNVSALDGKTLPAGLGIGGVYTSVTVDSGVVILFDA